MNQNSTRSEEYRSEPYQRIGRGSPMMLQWPQARKTGNMQRKKLDGRGIAPHSEPLTKIHVLRKERDCSTLLITTSPRHFNPRAPQERDIIRSNSATVLAYFNPRAPQGARHRHSRGWRAFGYFNPRAPQGARLLYLSISRSTISFQSTRSARSATCFPCVRKVLILISIHALRKERDEGV